MRFNTEYWDISLPVSAIQLITFVYFEYGYNCFDEDDRENAEKEYFANNGHIDYESEITKSITLGELPGLIQK